MLHSELGEGPSSVADVPELEDVGLGVEGLVFRGLGLHSKNFQDTYMWNVSETMREFLASATTGRGGHDGRNLAKGYRG